MRSFVIKDYYEFVDKNKLTEACSLFSDDISYIRNELQIKGKDELLNFYLNVRQLYGTHQILSVVERADYSFEVKGRFTGKDGEKSVDFLFSDIFYINNDNRIIKRITVY